jgi:hypothetical protein
VCRSHRFGEIHRAAVARLLLLAGVDQGWLCGILNGAIAPASMTWVVPVT